MISKTTTRIKYRRIHEIWYPSSALADEQPWENTTERVLLEVSTGIQPGDPDAKQILGRLLHALPEHGGRLHGSADADDHDVDDDGKPRRCWNATATFYGGGSSDEFDRDYVVAKVKALALEILDGEHNVPTVTVAQSKLFSELGIKLRKDGIFGYARRCGNPTCKETTDECFGDLDPAKAIEGAQKRAGVTCSTQCWLECGWGTDTTKNELIGMLEEGDYAQLLVDLGIAAKSDGGVNLVDDWLPRARAHAGAWTIVIDAADRAVEGSDYDGAEDAIECEV